MTEILHPCGCVDTGDGWVACANHIIDPAVDELPSGRCSRCHRNTSLHYDTVEQGFVSDCCTWPPLPNEAPGG